MQTLPIIDRPAWLPAIRLAVADLLDSITGAGRIAVTDIGQGPTLLFVHVGPGASYGVTSSCGCKTTSVVWRLMPRVRAQ